ncbi:MAG: glycerophosphodiester phosphodiesterase, partial [Gemmatimonadota bacterium]
PVARPIYSTVQDLLSAAGGPVAIAHRGMGENLGEDPTRPIENTIEALRLGFESGAAVVEADLQMTADGEIVVWHDDFLEDYTCINTLTRDQLAERAPWIDSFQALLQLARRYNAQNPDRLSGLVTVDLKPASPLCDPQDVTGPAFVSRVIEIIEGMGASDLIYFNSMSPVLLAQAAAEAPDIERQLTLLALQFLSPEQVEAAVGLPVTLIDKAPEFGLQWGEIGPIYRLPGYTPGPQGIQQAIATAHAVGASMVSWDLLLLGQLGAAAAADLVAATQATGLHVFSGDVSTPEEWYFGAGVGVEALYADNVPLAVELQGPID